MSTLSDSLNYLLSFLKELNPPLPRPQAELRIIEIGDLVTIDTDGRILIPEVALKEPADYSLRFEELTHSGLPWLNMTCYGLYKDMLIIGIEIPSITSKTKTPHTSVNYSGPRNAVLQRSWNASEIMEVT